MCRVCLIMSLALLVTIAACRRQEQTSGNASLKAGTTTSTAPADMSKAKVNAVIDLAEVKTVSESRLGSVLAKDGTVSADKNTFKRGEPVYLSMWLKESPGGLQTSASWFDTKNKQIDEERKPMNGAKMTTFKFAMKKPKPGKYHVTGYWGGNIAAEHDFTITK